MPRRWVVAVIVLTAALYVGAIVAGLRIKDFSLFRNAPGPASRMAWKAPHQSSIPPGPRGDSIRRGALLFNETPLLRHDTQAPRSVVRTAMLKVASSHTHRP